jgi:16S rRNA (cytosine967-C5)-methyltransferase
MDEASRLIPRLAGVFPGAAVWDACAAPGGKAMILRGLVGAAGLVVASDASLRRARLMRERMIDCRPEIPVCLADARKTPPFSRCFDAVLVDAPCSGTGTLRRNPEIKWRLSEHRLLEHHRTQLDILTAASQAVLPGGVLLYSTCSTEPEENESVIDRFLGLFPGFRLAAAIAPAETGFRTDGRGFLRTFPAERSWDGFFAARMLRLP